MFFDENVNLVFCFDNNIYKKDDRRRPESKTSAQEHEGPENARTFYTQPRLILNLQINLPGDPESNACAEKFIWKAHWIYWRRRRR